MLQTFQHLVPTAPHHLLRALGAQAVIAVSLWGLAGGGSIIFLRVFRAFRVMRLFKKLQPMRKILISLGACVKPVLSAFVILFILASIYAQVLWSLDFLCCAWRLLYLLGRGRLFNHRTYQ